MFKRLLFIFGSLALFFSSAFGVQAAQSPLFVSFVNPIRGMEGWIYEQGPLDLPRYQYRQAEARGFPVTWLLRFDAVSDATISAFFRELSATDSSQTVGAFFEITEQFAAAAGVTYAPGEYMSAANRIFLSGYDQSDRIRLIDTYMGRFYDIYGYYPNVVGAWHLDSFSLEYLEKKYSVITAVICDEQYNTDNYRLWGGYLGSPYFPSKLNFLVPATARENRVNIALTKWAARDPFNFYGIRTESNYSFQVNDYSFMRLTTKFFDSLLGIYSQNGFNEFSQVNIGLENDYSLASYQKEIENSYNVLKQNQAKYEIQFISLADFGQWLRSRYTFTNPAFFYQTKDVTGKKEGTIYWYQNPFYRLGLKSEAGKTYIIDFRLYNQKEAESHYLTKNISPILYAETNPLVDTIKYPKSEVALDIDLEKTIAVFDHWKVSFKEGEKELRLEPERIVFSGQTVPVLPTDEIKINRKDGQTIWQIKPALPFVTPPFLALLGVAIVTLLAGLLFFREKKARLIIALGWLIAAPTLVTVVRSGLIYPFGLGLWGPNGHDALFHLSLSEHFANNLLSLAHPQLSGIKLANYHFGFDWLIGIVNRLTALPQLDLYFRLAPAAIILVLVFLLTRLLASWRYSSRETILAFGLAFLSGSAGFIVKLLSGGNPVSGESVFWSNQSVSLLLNPPFALSLVVLVGFLYLLEKRPHRLSLSELVVLSLLGGALAQIKIYAFLLLVTALLIKKKFPLFLSVSLTGLFFLLPSLSFGGLPFVFNPLWFPKSMFESFDRLYWPRLASAWQVYENNGVLAKLFAVNLLAVVVFYAGNFWLRLLGLPKLFAKNLSLSQNLVKLIIVIGAIIPLLFTQKVNPWNTIQFMYYSLFFLSLFAAKQIGEWLHHLPNYIFLAISLLIVAASSVTSIGTLSEYLTAQSASRVSLTELRALESLSRQPDGIVVSPLTYSRVITPFPDPRPLYVYVSTAYISALSGKPEYISDTINLDITGYDYGDRAKNALRLYQTHDPVWVNQFLAGNKIKYVYETPLSRLKVRTEDVCLIEFFDSGEISIYKYSCP